MIRTISMGLGLFIAALGAFLTIALVRTRRKLRREGKKCPSPLGGAIGVIVIFGVMSFPFIAFGRSSDSDGQADNAVSNTQALSSALARPGVEPPEFVLLPLTEAGVMNGVVAEQNVVVPEQTSETQIASLLWHLRDDIRSESYDDDLSGLDGMLMGRGKLIVLRGRCEKDRKGANVCKGLSAPVASYSWSFDNSDAARMQTIGGQDKVVFQSPDGYKVPPAYQVKLDHLNASLAQGKAERDALAGLLETELQDEGYHIDAFQGQNGELVLVGEMFSTDSGRVSFLSDTLPHWRKTLCSKGFDTVRLKGGSFSVGDSHSIDCS